MALPLGYLRELGWRRCPCRLSRRARWRSPARALPALATAFGTTFWVALALTAASLVPALALPPRPATERQARQTPKPAARAGQ